MIAFNPEQLRNFKLLKEATRWQKSQVISEEQLTSIEAAHSHPFYTPPIWFKILLFIATFIAIMAVFGLFMMGAFSGGGDSEDVIRIILIVIGAACIFLLEMVAIENCHYKSGVTEALIFVGFSFLFFGIIGFDANEYTYGIATILTGLILWLRYLNLLGNIIALSGLGYLIFQALYELGPSFQASIPFVFFLLFSGMYLITSSHGKKMTWYYQESIQVLNSVLMVLIYLSVNYFVVRELSAEMMNLRLEPGEDIPFAFLFYGFTVLIPLAYLAYGIKNKRILFIRTGVALLFASVITYKYYYSSGHPEITLTLAGIFLTGITVWLLNKLKQPKNGFTREKLLTQEGLNAHTESILISTTLGGQPNQPTSGPNTDLGGGEFGGGGAGGTF